MKKIILTGDRPTGRLHVGHYVGSLKERVKLQNSGEFDDIYIMMADAQALTDNAEHPEKAKLFYRAQRKVEKKSYRNRKTMLYYEKERKKMQRGMGQDPYLDTPN